MATNSTGLKLFSTLNIFITDIMAETIQTLQSVFGQSNLIFTAASPFGQILLVSENLSQLIFYYLEDSITELNIYEASRPTSIYSLAAIGGHNPSRAMGSTGQVSISTIPGQTDVPSNRVILTNYFKMVCVNNGLPYVMEFPYDSLNFYLNGSTNNKTVAIRQGQIESQTIIARGVPYESFVLGSPNNFYIDNFLVNMYVNGALWPKYDSLLDIPRGQPGFIAKTGITNGLDIYVGNNSFGKTLPSGATVTIEYLVTDGSAGNLTAIQADQIAFTFKDTALTPIGDEVDLNKYVNITCITPPNFGADPESLELTRIIAPHASKNFALVNPDNYEILLRKLQLFSVIRVFLDPIDERTINLFLIPDVSKVFQTGSDYFNLPLENFTINPFQKNELLKYIEKSGTKFISTTAKILDPIISRYVINISVIVFDDVALDTIKSDIINTVGNYFISTQRSDRIPKSDIIGKIEQVNGVDSVSVNFVSEKNELFKIGNPLAPDAGIDAFNDIIIDKSEYAVIRGGWKDRYGNEYDLGLSELGLGAVNVQIKGIVPKKAFN